MMTPNAQHTFEYMLTLADGSEHRYGKYVTSGLWNAHKWLYHHGIKKSETAIGRYWKEKRFKPLRGPFHISYEGLKNYVRDRLMVSTGQYREVTKVELSVIRTK